MPSLPLLLKPEHTVDLTGVDRVGVLRGLTELAAPVAGLEHEALLQAVLEREELASTGFGDGLAMPHVRLSKARAFATVLGRAPTPIPFGAIDGAPVDLLLLIVGPEAERERYQKLLARAARFLKAEGPRLRGARDLAAATAELLVEY